MPQSSPERMLLTNHHALHEDDVRPTHAWRRTHSVPDRRAVPAQRAASGRIRLAAMALATAPHVRVPASPVRALGSYEGGACRDGGIEWTLRLIVLSDRRRILGCVAAVRAM